MKTNGTVNKYTTHTFTHLNLFSPFKTFDDAKEAVKSFNKTAIIDDFNVQHHDISGDTAKTVLKKPKQVKGDYYSGGKDPGLMIKTIGPPIGVYAKTRLPGEHISVHEALLRELVNTLGTIGSREFESFHLIDKDFRIISPHVYTEADVTEITLRKNGKGFRLSKQNEQTRLKISFEERRPVFASASEVNLEEWVDLNDTYVDELLHGEEIVEE